MANELEKCKAALKLAGRLAVACQNLQNATIVNISEYNKKVKETLIAYNTYIFSWAKENKDKKNGDNK